MKPRAVQMFGGGGGKKHFFLKKIKRKKKKRLDSGMEWKALQIQKEMMHFIKSLTTQKQEKKREEKPLRRPLEHGAFAKRVLLRLFTD